MEAHIICAQAGRILSSPRYKLGQCHDSTVLDFPTIKTKQNTKKKKKKTHKPYQVRIFIRISSC